MGKINRASKRIRHERRSHIILYLWRDFPKIVSGRVGKSIFQGAETIPLLLPNCLGPSP